MALEVSILGVDESGSTLDVSVAVSVDNTESVDYELNINDTGTGGTVSRSGTLTGGAGSFPGDSNIEEVSFGIGDTTGGTVTAVITAPDRYVGSEYQDQVNWGDSGSGPVEDPTVEVNNCDPQPTSNGDLDVSYTLAPSDGSSRDVGITIKVDGQRVGFQNHYVPGRGGSFSQTIAADRLPTGTDMPVEIGVDGDFSECGTVTVESDDPADDPEEPPEPPEPPEVEPPRIEDCAVLSENPLQVEFVINGDEGGNADVSLTVGGETVATETVPYFTNPATHTISAPTSDLPVGENMNIQIRIT